MVLHFLWCLKTLYVYNNILQDIEYHIIIINIQHLKLLSNKLNFCSRLPNKKLY